jgi:two-component system, NarL family, sensor histidine kinase DevS
VWREPIRRRTRELLREFVERADELVRTEEHVEGLLGAVVSLTEDLSLESQRVRSSGRGTERWA